MGKIVKNDVFCKAVYEIVSSIPKGKVTTYGEIARLLGCPQASRLVGWALKCVPEDLNLPCHRVVNAQGRLVPSWDQQRVLLIREGISFLSSGRVNMKLHLWQYEGLKDVLEA